MANFEEFKFSSALQIKSFPLSNNKELLSSLIWASVQEPYEQCFITAMYS